MAISSTEGIPLLMAFKVLKVSVWSPPPSQGSTGHAAITWTNLEGTASEAAQVSDVTMSTAFPAYCSATPPQGTYASMWNSYSTVNLFKVHVDAGGVVDLTIEAVINDGNDYLTTLTLVGATPGTVYYNSLESAQKLVQAGLTAAPV
jgi:hypothetical protein